MRSTSWLIRKLKADYPKITFVEANTFSWSPNTQTVSYNPLADGAVAQILHELSHAILEHTTYKRDIELVSMETDAWSQAAKLAESYDLIIKQESAQDHLDTYRDWLHARSSCPECTATGYQIDAAKYECTACSNRWMVNEARLCGLKRYKIK